MLFRHIVEKLIQLTGAGESEEGQRLDAVTKHLQSLPMETLLKLQLLMYFGRGDDPDIYALFEYLSDPAVTPDAADVIRTLATKRPLAEYLSRGVQALDKAGIDLETLPKFGPIPFSKTVH